MFTNQPSVVACVTSQYECDRIIETAEQLAAEYDCELHVLSVLMPTENYALISDQLEYLNRVSKYAGADMTVIFSSDAPKAAAKFVRENNEGESLAASLLSTEEPEWAEYVTATDRFGFAALASAGSYNPENSFTGDDRTFFWSRTQDTFGDDDYDDAHMFLVQPLDEVVWVGSAGKIAQYSVRCIKY